MKKRRRPATDPRKAGAKPRFAGAIAWVVLAAVLMAGGAFWLWQIGPSVPDLPKISTISMDPVAAKLIEEHLESVRHSPRSGAAWGKLGALLRSFEFREEAGRCLDTAERLDSREPRWPYLQGLLLADQSPSEALARLRRAVALCGSTPEAPRLRLAKALAEAGEWEEATQQLQALTRAKPDYAPAGLALAQAMFNQGKMSDAIGYANACQNDPQTARAAWSLLAVLQQRLGDTNAARTAGLKLASLPPDAPLADPFEAEGSAVRTDPRDLSDRSQRLLEAGRVAEASPFVTSLVREHPHFAEGWLLLGRWQLLGREAVSAERSLRRHLELERDSINGLFQLGMALLAQQKFAEAATEFQRALRLKPDSGPAFYNLGFALVRSGRPREAVAPFREAIRHNPERIDSYILLADLHVQLGEKAEAEALLRQAETINPNDRRLPVLRDQISRL